MLVGALSGAVGAVGAGRLLQAPAESRGSPPVVDRAPPEREVIVPPGWDAVLHARVSNLESRVDDLSARSTAPAQAPTAAPAQPADPSSSRERERTEHYEKELAHRERLLGEHEREAVDRAWAVPQSDVLARSLADQAAGQSVEVERVDCRSNSCVASLTFPSPMSALTYLQDTRHLVVRGCNGFTAIPTPPADDGPYDLSVHYKCR
jgi:hypothetical protein